MDTNNRNLFLTIGLSVLILTLWQIFYVNPQIEAERQAQLEQQAVEQQVQPGTESAGAGTPQTQGATASGEIPQATVSGSAPGMAGEAAGAAGDRASALSTTDRIPVDTPTLSGSINLTGARFDDLSLKNYHVTVDETSPIVDLLSPVTGPDAYFAEFGWTGANLPGLPTADTVLQAEDVVYAAAVSGTVAAVTAGQRRGTSGLPVGASVISTGVGSKNPRFLRNRCWRSAPSICATRTVPTFEDLAMMSRTDSWPP